MVDRRYREEFTPFYFDLVVNDEAHRSIYGDAREVVQFFQATRIGLTATPRAYLKNVNVEELQKENPKALEARLLRDTYNYFGCKPGFPTFRYDIIDAVKDPEGPFLCLPKILICVPTSPRRHLKNPAGRCVVNEQEENFKIQDLERKIFTPARNRVMCEAFLKEAQRDPTGQNRQIHRVRGESEATPPPSPRFSTSIQPGIAVTITSRIQDASSIAKEFRDGKRSERIAVSVDMLSTGYNCRDALNIGLMRPIFSPTEYIQIKGRGTRLVHVQNRQHGIRKEEFLHARFLRGRRILRGKIRLHASAENSAREKRTAAADSISARSLVAANRFTKTGGTTEPTPPPPRIIPTWEGVDTLVSREITIVGPDGEKVDVMTFRGGYERDIREFVDRTPDLKAAIEAEDDDAVETIVNEQFYHRPKMYYSPDKLVQSYGVPASTPAFVYNAVGRKPLPTRDAIVTDTVDQHRRSVQSAIQRTEVGGHHRPIDCRRFHGVAPFYDGRHHCFYGQSVSDVGRAGCLGTV